MHMYCLRIIYDVLTGNIKFKHKIVNIKHD